MKNILSRVKSHLFPLCVIMAVAMIISVKHLNEPPAYIHAWAQADNYSLALGFTHNGGDLFHPHTLIYNKQQKDFSAPLSLVTGCDLPLHHWIAAGLMAITGSHEPWVFRSLTLAVAIAGLLMLYLLVYVITCSRAKSLIVATLTATAPSFAYYSSSFLPTIPAISMAVAGLLFYALHLRDDKLWMLYAGLLFLTLSMMTRTSFAVLWVAVACFQFLRIMCRETSLRTSWLPFVLGAVLFVSWWLWNWHLRNEYGSLFLSSLLPVRSVEQARYVMQNVHDRWMFHYFQRMQHWLYVAVAIVAVISLIIKWKEAHHENKQLSLWWFIAIWFFGEMLFAAAMSRQYCDHDYYFLDSFFLPIVLLLAMLLKQIPNPTKLWSRIGALIIVLTLTWFMTDEACQMQKLRRQEGVDAFETAVRYKYANKMLEETGFGSRDLRFLTLFAYPQNTPFVMMDREGYAVMSNKPAAVAHALTFDFDYILIEDEVYRQEFDDALYILPRLQRLAGNGEISVCTLSDSTLHTTADHFFERN